MHTANSAKIKNCNRKIIFWWKSLFKNWYFFAKHQKMDHEKKNQELIQIPVNDILKSIKILHFFNFSNQDLYLYYFHYFNNSFSFSYRCKEVNQTKVFNSLRVHRYARVRFIQDLQTVSAVCFYCNYRCDVRGLLYP